MQIPGAAEEDSPFGRHDDLDNTQLTTGYLLDCFQEMFEMREISRCWSEDVKSFHHMTRALEPFWAFRCDMVGRLLAALYTHRLLQGMLTVSRRVDEVINSPCSQSQNQVSKLSVCVYVYRYLYISMLIDI